MGNSQSSASSSSTLSHHFKFRNDSYDAAVADASKHLLEAFPHLVNTTNAKKYFLRRGDKLTGFIHPLNWDYYDLRESKDGKYIVVRKNSQGFIRDALFREEKDDIGVGVERLGLVAHAQHSMTLCDGDNINVGMLHVSTRRLGSSATDMLIAELYPGYSWHHQYTYDELINTRLSSFVSTPLHTAGRLLIFYMDGSDRPLKPMEELPFVINEHQNAVRVTIERPEDAIECIVWMLIETREHLVQSRDCLVRTKLDFLQHYGHMNVATWNTFLDLRQPHRVHAPPRILELFEDDQERIQGIVSAEKFVEFQSGGDVQRLGDFKELSSRYEELYGIPRSEKQLRRDVERYLEQRGHSIEQLEEEFSKGDPHWMTGEELRQEKRVGATTTTATTQPPRVISVTSVTARREEHKKRAGGSGTSTLQK
mmetsp:Transcript_4085/g.15369  ORF Transcript_4085/g.15369 Transcript_4085/m.15369 type:complete len:424 (+) Transcript_4085:1311-2582(+)